MAGKTKVGVIGVGQLGQHHARIYSTLPQVELVGVADINGLQASRIADRYHCQWFTDYHQLFDRVEAVSVVVPTRLHHPIAKDCLSAGLHVLVEKPITPSLNEAEELLLLSSQKNLILQVGHIERFNAAVQELQKHQSNPKLIEAERLGPFNPRTSDVGVVLDLMIHDIDIILNIVKSPVKRMDAIGMSILSPFEDVASLRLEFESGCVANITASRVHREKARRMMIFQENMYVMIDYISQDITLYRRDLSQGTPDDPQRSIIIDKVPLMKEEPLKLELEDFIESVQSGTEPQVTGRHAKVALEIGLQALKQISQGKKN